MIFFLLFVFFRQAMSHVPCNTGPQRTRGHEKLVWSKSSVKTRTFADLFDHFSSGAEDKTAPLKDMDKYTLNVNIGQKKTRADSVIIWCGLGNLFHAWETC